jgi:glycosyltransferase involved in cell wall biosynthesis
VTVEPLSPFGRGFNAPLAGRTIVQIAPPGASAGEKRETLAIAEALIEAGARALIVSDPGEFASEAQAVGALHVSFPASTKNPLAMMFNVRRLARILSDERVDLVHARSRASAWVALGACRKLRRALVTTIPGEGPADRPRTSFESAVAEGDLVVAASTYAAERAAEAFPSARTRLRIVRPGLDVARLSPSAVSRSRVAKVREGWGVAPHERVVLAPGRLTPARGPSQVVEAAALIAKRGLEDVRFVLAGEAPRAGFGRELDALAAERGVKGIVARAGPEADRPAAFVGASVVVFPTREAEGVTRAVIEAAAAGALTVVADVGAAREIVVAPPYAQPEQRSGWLIPAGDALALAEAIEAALTVGASAREATRKRSRDRVAADYSLAAMTRDTLIVYAEALRQRGQ